MLAVCLNGLKEKGQTASENRLFASHGNPGGLRWYFYGELCLMDREFLNHLLSLLSHEKRADWLNTGASFGSAGDQLYLEKPGVRHCSVAGGAVWPFPSPFMRLPMTDGAGAWKCFTWITSAKPSPLPFYHCGAVLCSMASKCIGRPIWQQETIHRKRCIFCSICSITGTETLPLTKCPQAAVVTGACDHGTDPALLQRAWERKDA